MLWDRLLKKARDNVGKSYKWDDLKHVEAEAAVKLSQQFENVKVYVKPSLINYGFTDSLNGCVWSNYTYGSSYDSIAAGLAINYAW